MKKLLTFATATRTNAFLCCSAAALLTACGGNATDSSGQQARTAAVIESVDAGAADAAAVTPNQADAPTTAASAAATAASSFDLAGYDASPAPDAAAQDGADAAAPAHGATRLLASVTSVTPASNMTAVPATATNYYVAPTGSDSAAGTKAAPFKTLAQAAKKATAAGTTVFVAPGTYAGGIKTTANGTAAARIYWVSTTKWGAKIVPPSSSSNNNAWDNRGNYVSIIGFDVDGTSTGSGTAWTHGIYTGGSYGMISDNHIHNLAQKVACTSAGGSAIGVDSYYHGVQTDVVGNTVNDIGPSGCTYVQGIYFSTSGTIKNNLVYRVGAVAIHLWHDATNVIITNNTAAASNFGIVVGGGDFYYTSAGANNVYVANNIVYDNVYGISEQGTTGKANTYKNNLVYKNTNYAFSLRNSLKDSATVASDPLFAGYTRTAAAPNFHLSASSPAIGRGIATNAYATDIDGKARNATTGYDIGAYQH